MGAAHHHPIETLNGQTLGGYRLDVARLEPTDKSGWRFFELQLVDEGGPYMPAVVTGLHSVGGRGVAPWIEVLRYHPRLRQGQSTLDLGVDGLDVLLFKRLAQLIPAGGHLMIWCEGAVHRLTHLALHNGVPPVLTPLGQILYSTGFPKVRFFDVAEGGLEGEQKLWAEKPMDQAMHAHWTNQTREALEAFLARPPGNDLTAIYHPAAKRLINELEAANGPATA